MYDTDGRESFNLKYPNVWKDYPTLFNSNVDNNSFGSETGYLRRGFIGGSYYTSRYCGTRSVMEYSASCRITLWLSSRGCNKREISWGASPNG